MVANHLDEIPEPQAVANWTADEQSSWAKEYGATLWEMHGDDQVVVELDEDELSEDRKEAWDVVYSENESRITADVNTVSGMLSADALFSAIQTGFYEAYDKAASQ